MLAYFAQRAGAGLTTVAASAWMYVTTPVLVVIALVPVGLRLAQVLRGAGTPQGSPASEVLVGGFRVLLALAALAVAAGWRPLADGLRPPSLEGLGASWGRPGFDWGGMAVDLMVYVLIYGALHLVVTAASGAVGPRLGGDPDTVVGMVQFGFKNLLVIPVGAIHMLWLLRLIDPATRTLR